MNRHKNLRFPTKKYSKGEVLQYSQVTRPVIKPVTRQVKILFKRPVKRLKSITLKIKNVKNYWDFREETKI